MCLRRTGLVGNGAVFPSRVPQVPEAVRGGLKAASIRGVPCSRTAGSQAVAVWSEPCGFQSDFL